MMESIVCYEPSTFLSLREKGICSELILRKLEELLSLPLFQNDTLMNVTAAHHHHTHHNHHHNYHHHKPQAQRHEAHQNHKHKSRGKHTGPDFTTLRQQSLSQPPQARPLAASTTPAKQIQGWLNKLSPLNVSKVTAAVCDVAKKNTIEGTEFLRIVTEQGCKQHLYAQHYAFVVAEWMKENATNGNVRQIVVECMTDLCTRIAPMIQECIQVPSHPDKDYDAFCEKTKKKQYLIGGVKLALQMCRDVIDITPNEEQLVAQALCIVPAADTLANDGQYHDWLDMYLDCLMVVAEMRPTLLPFAFIRDLKAQGKLQKKHEFKLDDIETAVITNKFKN